jgi:hypothetical protein
MDWSSISEIFVGVIAGGLVNAYFSRRGSKELRREASDLRQRSQSTSYGKCTLRHTPLIYSQLNLNPP